MRKLFSLLFSVSLIMVACNKEDDSTQLPSGDSKEPILELTSDKIMTFTAEGGDAQITYNLTKGDEAFDSGLMSQPSPVSVKTDDEWIIINKDDSYYGVLLFSVAKNDTNEDREGLITVSYYSKSFEVVVKQSAMSETPEPPQPTVQGWAIVGTFTNNWDVASAVAMESIEGYYVARGVEVSTSDSFKFILDGSMQNGLGGNGQAAERDHKYPASKYGSDIRVKESGIYDLYINEELNTYYVMSEGKTPADAHEVVDEGKDVWYVQGLGEEISMRKIGIYQVVSNVSLDEDGFKFRSTLQGGYGAESEDVYDIDSEITIISGSEINIKVNYEEGKLYDIYLAEESMKVWVVPTGKSPNVIHECFDAEGAWFYNNNFYIYLEADGIKLTFECMLASGAVDYIIPETTFEVLYGEDRTNANYIDADACEIANANGKTKVVSGTITVAHCEDGYDVMVDVVNHLQQNIRAHYVGEFSHGIVGSPIVVPINE
ncbi:MAG: BACON domain-containing protein [Alistipes sp.]|nr:BACON domain-containing protein [Alistipes sp.]